MTKLTEKNGKDRLAELGFDPILKLVDLYHNLEEDISSEGDHSRSPVFYAAIRGHQKAVLSDLLPYSYHKVEPPKVSEELQELPPVVIQVAVQPKDG